MAKLQSGTQVFGNLIVNSNVTLGGGIYTTTGLFWAGNGYVISTGGGGGSASGVTTQIQYNSSGTFAAANLLYYSANNTVVANSGISSTSTTSGTFQVLGGVGITGNLNAGTTSSTIQHQILSGSQFAPTAGSILVGAHTVLSGSGSNYLTLGQYPGNGAANQYGQWIQSGYSGNATYYPIILNPLGGNVVVGATTTSTSSTTGALVVQGGTGIGGNLYVSSGISASTVSATTLSGTLSTASQPNITSLGTLTSLSTGNVGIGTSPIYGLGVTNYIGGYPTTTGVFAGTNSNYAQIRLTATPSTGGIVDFGLPNADYRGRILYAVTGDQMQFSAGGTQVMTLANTANGGATISTTLTGQNIIPSANVTYNLGSTTAWWSTVYGTAIHAQYADLAENYTADAEYSPGTVVVFGGEQEITVTTQSHDPRVAGVISTNPAYLMNGSTPGLPVAMTGRVPCQVQGPVTKGQVLVTSTTVGVAQAISNDQFIPGCVVGKALESINTNTIKTIEVVVGRF